MKTTLLILAAVAAAGCSTRLSPLAHVDIPRVTEFASHVLKTDNRVTAPSEGLELNNIQASFGATGEQSIITLIFTDPSSQMVLTRDADGKPKQQSIRVVRVFLTDTGSLAGVEDFTETFEEPEWKNY